MFLILLIYHHPVPISQGSFTAVALQLALTLIFTMWIQSISWYCPSILSSCFIFLILFSIVLLYCASLYNIFLKLVISFSFFFFNVLYFVLNRVNLGLTAQHQSTAVRNFIFLQQQKITVTDFHRKQIIWLSANLALQSKKVHLFCLTERLPSHTLITLAARNLIVCLWRVMLLLTRSHIYF